MKAVAINGSPRAGGNTEIMPRKVLAPLEAAGWSTEYRQIGGKIGAAVAAVRRGGATHIFDSINHMFLIASMIVPGSLYWNLGMGLDKGDVLNDEEAMRNMRHLGETIAWLGTAMTSAFDASPFPKVAVELG